MGHATINSTKSLRDTFLLWICCIINDPSQSYLPVTDEEAVKSTPLSLTVPSLLAVPEISMKRCTLSKLIFELLKGIRVDLGLHALVVLELSLACTF